MVNEAEVFLDLRVANVVPVADIRVVKPLKEKVPVGVYRDFLEGFADLDAQFDAPQARLFGDPLEHPVGKVARLGLLFLALNFRSLTKLLVFWAVLFSGLKQIDQLVGVVAHVDLAHVQHDQLGPELVGHLDGFHRVLVGVVAFAGVGGGELEDVRIGVVAADRQRTEIVQGGNLDHPGLDRLHNPGDEAQADAVAQLGILKAEVADFLKHLAAIGVAVGVPAGGEGIHGVAKK